VASYTRAEMEEAFAHYQKVAAEAARSGDWRPWAELFTDDATYIEHVFGQFTGPDQIHAWITKTMATPPNDEMREFPIDWAVIDEQRGWIVAAIWNRMTDPGDGQLHQAINWTLLKYAGANKWSWEEDLYNPLEFASMIKDWQTVKG